MHGEEAGRPAMLFILVRAVSITSQWQEAYRIPTILLSYESTITCSRGTPQEEAEKHICNDFNCNEIALYATINRVKMVITDYQEDREGVGKRYIQFSRYLLR